MKRSRFRSSLISLLLFSFTLFGIFQKNLQAATITVTNTGDAIAVDGAVTLREAIASINGQADQNADVTAQRSGGYGISDTIQFNIGTGTPTISVGASTNLPLPIIVKPVVINGNSGGATRVELQGTNAGANADGIAISGGGSTINALVINQFTRDGINLSTFGGNTITGCYIGTNSAGDTDQGNGHNGIGIISSDGTTNTIGGTTVAARNIVSGNDSDGIAMQGNTVTKTVVVGNFIGTDVTGTQAIGNSFIGIEIDADAHGNTIGGPLAGEGNLISGNNLHGVNIQSGGSGCTDNIVQGNRIGTDVTGSLSVPNLGDGVSLIGAVFNNVIGGTASGAGNLIAFNQRNGVNVVTQSGTPTGNAIWGNSILSNGQLGIDLNDDGVTPNDAGDGDTGPNNLQNFPVLSSVTTDGCTTTVQGTLNGTANTTFRIEFFSNDSCDSSGNGEGQTLIGATNVTTDGSGNATFNLPISTAVTPGQVITATATDLTPNNTNTSEFSACFTVPPITAPGTLQFSAPTYSANENGGTAAVIVTRSCGSSGAVSVDFATSDGTAMAGADYTAVTQTVTFADGDTADKTISIFLLDDTLLEGDETVNLTLSNPTGGATLGIPNPAVLTIVDDETAGTEVCNNGVDDNGNGLVDCNDPGCASDPSCVTINGGGCSLVPPAPFSASTLLLPLLAIGWLWLRKRKTETF